MSKTQTAPLSESSVKKIVKEAIKPLEHRLDGVEHRLDGVEHRLDGVEKKLDRYSHQVLEKLDKVMDELETMRQESTLSAHTQSGHTDQLEDHETRILALEKPV